MRWRCVIYLTSRPFTKEDPLLLCSRHKANTWRSSLKAVMTTMSRHLIILWLHEYWNWSIVFPKPKKLNPSCSSIAGLDPRSPRHFAWIMFIIHTEHQLLVASAFSKISSIFNILVELSYWIFWKESGDCDATSVLLSNQGCYVK